MYCRQRGIDFTIGRKHFHYAIYVAVSTAQASQLTIVGLGPCFESQKCKIFDGAQGCCCLKLTCTVCIVYEHFKEIVYWWQQN
jgi:hypothetical protein